MLRNKHVLLTLAILLFVPSGTAAIDLPTGHTTTATSDTCGGECPYYPYIAGPGIIVDQTGAVVTACAERCDLDGDGYRETDSIGKVLIRASTSYNNVLIGVHDDLWGNNAAQRACLVDADGACLEDGGSDWTCGGTNVVLNSPFASDTVAVFIVTMRVDADLEVCGGTMGSVGAHWF